MRVLSIANYSFFEFPFSSVGDGGAVLRTSFPLIRAKVDRLPENLDALVLCSDLQGIVDSRIDGRTTPEQMGVVLAETLFELSIDGQLPDAQRIGIVLCGDLYVQPQLQKRGGRGDVRSVWNAFAEYFALVMGVAGNHDWFGDTVAEVEKFSSRERIHLLDGTTSVIGGMLFAGIGGIIGDSSKPQRRSEKDFVAAIRKLATQRPDVLLLHQGPSVPALSLPGNDSVRQALHRAGIGLVACGHVHWKFPLAELPDGTQVINADNYGLVLQLD